MTLSGEARRRHDTEVALSNLQRALELLHDARVRVSEHHPEMGPGASRLIFGLEGWMEDVRAVLKPH